MSQKEYENIKELQKNVVFDKVTYAGIKENQIHGLINCDSCFKIPKKSEAIINIA